MTSYSKAMHVSLLNEVIIIHYASDFANFFTYNQWLMAKIAIMYTNSFCSYKFIYFLVQVLIYLVLLLVPVVKMDFLCTWE